MPPPIRNDDRPEPEPKGFPGRNLLPTGRREQIALVGLGALAVVLSGAILVRRAMQTPAPFHLRAQRPDIEVLYRIDINAALAAELQLLPGIGRSLAARIVQSREAYGSFATADDLARVRGVTPEMIETLRPLVRTAPEPVEPWK